MDTQSQAHQTCDAMEPQPHPASTSPSPTPALPSTPSPHDGGPAPAPAPRAAPTCSKEANRYKTPDSGEQDDTAYRRAEKQYRRQRVAVNRRRTRYVRQDPNLAEAVDFAREGVEDDPRVHLVAALEDGRRIYALRDRPGFYYVRGTLDWGAQAYWARCCLRDFSRSPFTNITNHRQSGNDQAEVDNDQEDDENSGSSLWERAVRTVEAAGIEGEGEGGVEGEGGLTKAVQDLHALRWANLGLNYIWTTRQYAAPAVKDADGEQEGQEGGGGVDDKDEGLERGAFVRKEGQEEQVDEDEEQNGREEGKGVYLHNTRREEEGDPVEARHHQQHQASTSQASFPVPPVLTELARSILSLVAHADKHEDECPVVVAAAAAEVEAEKANTQIEASAGAAEFQAEAGIVNYYPPESSMGGHVDDAEGALEVPLVSFSLGLGGVFLLGGRSKEVEPVPIVFRSGDCMVMGGEARVCFHGVPCVLLESARPDERLVDWRRLAAAVVGEGKEEGGEGQEYREAEARLLAHYLASSRVNFNVRQVWRRRGGRRREERNMMMLAGAHQQ